MFINYQIKKEKNIIKIIANVELGEKMIKLGNLDDFGKLLPSRMD